MDSIWHRELWDDVEDYDRSDGGDDDFIPIQKRWMCIGPQVVIATLNLLKRKPVEMWHQNLTWITIYRQDHTI